MLFCFQVHVLVEANCNKPCLPGRQQSCCILFTFLVYRILTDRQVLCKQLLLYYILIKCCHIEIIMMVSYSYAQQGHDPLSNGNGVGGKNAESAAALRTLLTRWREKVFVMLVQQKLSQIHDSRVRHEILRKVFY